VAAVLLRATSIRELLPIAAVSDPLVFCHAGEILSAGVVKILIQRMTRGYSVREMDPMVEIQDEQSSPHLPQLLAFFLGGDVFFREENCIPPE
jgi:hypothetical protein